MNGSLITRRSWLKTAGVVAVGAGLGAHCAGRSERKFAKVKVSPDRVIRTVAGLRPFRPSGFLVKSEKFDKKIVIHNYGHGGGGVTMSWGTSHLAMEEALKTGESTYAVMGCGALGLATARLLQRRGLEVTIYAKDLPPKTTSNVACASWYPAESADPNKRTPEWIDQFTRAARLSYRYFQDLVGDYYGIHWYENYTLSDEPPDGRGPDGRESTIRDLFPEVADLDPREHPFGHRYCRRTWNMLIEPPIYLNAVLRDFRLAGGKVVVREFDDLEGVLSLQEPVIMNCTGIGAKALFNDEELMPIKGQLTILLPQPEIDYMMVADGLYMMPRKDGVLLGGTHERGEWSLEPNPVEMQRVMNGHVEFFQNMA
ncbi:MAG: FAD-dependent oxidoreductase [Vicinamibacteria bacterium]